MAPFDKPVTFFTNTLSTLGLLSRWHGSDGVIQSVRLSRLSATLRRIGRLIPLEYVQGSMIELVGVIVALYLYGCSLAGIALLIHCTFENRHFYRSDWHFILLWPYTLVRGIVDELRDNR